LTAPGARGTLSPMGRAGWIALSAVGTIVFVLGLKLASRDDPAPQDADLLPAAASLSAPGAAADDAYPAFLKLRAALALSPEERDVLNRHFDGKISSETAVAGFIARNAESLALFAELSRYANFQDPAYRDLSAVGPATPVPQMVSVVSAAKMSSLQAKALFERGRAREALEQALSIVAVGRMFARSRSTMICELVGLLVLDIGSKRALQIMAGGKLDRAQLLAAAAALSPPTGAAAGLQEALRYEYVSEVHILDHLAEDAAKGQPPAKRLMMESVAKGGSYLYLPHRTKALFAARLRLFIAAAGRPCLQANVPPFEILPWKLRPNMVGLILYNIAVPSYEKINIRRCESDFRLTSAAAAAALQAYRLDHGRYPASLSELTPEYLGSAPVDSFNGGAPLYSAETGEIHSAGKDSEGKPL
jgi:hypothetical protein